MPLHRPHWRKTPHLLALALLALGLLLLWSTRAVSTDDFEATPGAPQYFYQQGVPHTDGQGRLLHAYQPGRSFLPRGLYHAMTGDFSGHAYSFAPLAAAGFNCVHLWEGLRLRNVLPELQRERLQVIIHNPAPPAVALGAVSEQVLGWYLDEEPTGKYSLEEMAGRLAAFRQRYEEIRRVDPLHPIFPLDTNAVGAERREWWLKWAALGDLAVHDNYPFREGTDTLDKAKGLPTTLPLALEATGQAKPVWFVAQAFATDGRKPPAWVLPTPEQLRCQTYAAFILGATGIIYFAEDSWFTRQGGVLGVAPNAPTDWGGEDPRRWVVSEPQAQCSRELWATLTTLNGELRRLEPVLLSPTSDLRYQVAVRGDRLSPTPVRCLLKSAPDGLYLLAVNLDGRSLEARFTFPGPLASARDWPEDRPASGVADRSLTASFPPWGVRVYRLSLR